MPLLTFSTINSSSLSTLSISLAAPLWSFESSKTYVKKETLVLLTDKGLTILIESPHG